MSANIGVLVLYGISAQQPGFSAPLVAELQKRLPGLAGRVMYREAFWADLLNGREAHLWKRLSRDYDLDWVTVRKFVINVLADAIAYQRIPGAQADTYHAIHARIHESLVHLRKDLGGHDRPLVIVAHSLGSVILSNYIWDEQTHQGLIRSIALA